MCRKKKGYSYSFNREVAVLDDYTIANIDAWKLIECLPCGRCGTPNLIWVKEGTAPRYRVCCYCGASWIAKQNGNMEIGKITLKPISGITEESYKDYCKIMDQHSQNPINERIWNSFNS